MVQTMAKDPIVFAMANPTPEIDYHVAMEARPDIIMATGRSDFPNQVNNVLGFPFIFRGALDVRATEINEEMKLAAVRAIASLAHEPVPEVVMMAYSESNMSFGPTYIIPKPMDPRLITTVAPAVAKAAMDSGVAKAPINNWDAYEKELRKRLGIDNDFVNRLMIKAKKNPKKVVFAEADNVRILRAAQGCVNDAIAEPILLGKPELIHRMMEENNIQIPNVTIIDPRREDEKRTAYGKLFFEKRRRRGVTLYEAEYQMRNRNYFGSMMVENGDADVFISGLSRNYPLALKPALASIGMDSETQRVSGMHIMMSKYGPLFFADTTVNVELNEEELFCLVKNVYSRVKNFQIEPKIALISYSNFGSNSGKSPTTMRRVIDRLHKEEPHIKVDGEMQPVFALDGEQRFELYPFNKLGNDQANTFIFPALNSANAAYQLLRTMGASEAIGPVLLGMNKTVHILHHSSTVREIINMVGLAVCEAQDRAKR